MPWCSTRSDAASAIVVCQVKRPSQEPAAPFYSTEAPRCAEGGQPAARSITIHPAAAAAAASWGGCSGWELFSQNVKNLHKGRPLCRLAAHAPGGETLRRQQARVVGMSIADPACMGSGSRLRFQVCSSATPVALLMHSAGCGDRPTSRSRQLTRKLAGVSPGNSSCFFCTVMLKMICGQHSTRRWTDSP